MVTNTAPEQIFITMLLWFDNFRDRCAALLGSARGLLSTGVRRGINSRSIPAVFRKSHLPRPAMPITAVPVLVNDFDYNQCYSKTSDCKRNIAAAKPANSPSEETNDGWVKISTESRSGASALNAVSGISHDTGSYLLPPSGRSNHPKQSGRSSNATIPAGGSKQHRRCVSTTSSSSNSMGCTSSIVGQTAGPSPLSREKENLNGKICSISVASTSTFISRSQTLNATPGSAEIAPLRRHCRNLGVTQTLKTAITRREVLSVSRLIKNSNLSSPIMTIPTCGKVEGGINDRNVKNILTQRIDDSTDHSLIHLAVSKSMGSPAILRAILEEFDEIGRIEIVNVKTERGGYTPLHLACKSNHIDIANYLLDNGASPDVKTHLSSTPLHFASSAENLDLCESLLLKGANPNCVSKVGSMPLMHAVQRGNESLVDMLLRYGANPRITIEGSGESARSLALKYNYTGILEKIDLSISRRGHVRQHSRS